MEKTRQMQDEMERFEAEILSNIGPPGVSLTSGIGVRRDMASSVAPPPPPPPSIASGPVLRAGPRQVAPPPPPPRNMFMPAQLMKPRSLAPPPPPPSVLQQMRPMPMQFHPGQNFRPMMGPMMMPQHHFQMGMMQMGPMIPQMMPSKEEAPVVSEPTKLIISGAPQRYDKPKDQGGSEQPAEKKQKTAEEAPVDISSGDAKSKSSHAAAATGTTPPSKSEKQSKKKQKKFVRVAGGTAWEDPSLQDWDPSDYRIFCGDLGNDVTDEVLARVFGKYPSFQKAKVIRDKRSNKTKGYGFVSFKDPQDFIRAMKEVNGKYVGSRPIKLRKSDWRKRNVEEVKKKEKEKQLLGL